MSESFDLNAEKDLIERAKSEPEAFGQLYDRYYEQILQYCIYKTYDVALAHDLVADTFIKALQKIHTFKWQKFRFSAWLYSIARNEVNMYWRKNNRVFMVNIDEAATIKSKEETDQGIIKKQDTLEKNRRLKFFHEQLKDLKPIEQDIIIFHYIEEKTYIEIADLVGKKPGTVKVITHRAIKKIKERIADVKDENHSFILAKL